MKLSTRIAAAKRQLRRMEEHRPRFLEAIANYTPAQQAMAIEVFDRALAETQSELDQLKTASKDETLN